MPDLEIMPYKRVDKPAQTHKRRKLPHIHFDLHLYDILFRCIGFFLARAIPFAGMSPFGISFLAQERAFSGKTLVTMLAVCGGSLLLPDQLSAAKYITAALLYAMFLFVLERSHPLSVMSAAVAAGCALFLPGIFFMHWQGYTAANLFLLTAESLICMLGSVVFDKSRAVLEERRLFPPPWTRKKKSAFAWCWQWFCSA